MQKNFNVNELLKKNLIIPLNEEVIEYGISNIKNIFKKCIYGFSSGNMNEIHIADNINEIITQINDCSVEFLFDRLLNLFTLTDSNHLFRKAGTFPFSSSFNSLFAICYSQLQKINNKLHISDELELILKRIDLKLNLKRLNEFLKNKENYQERFYGWVEIVIIIGLIYQKKNTFSVLEELCSCYSDKKILGDMIFNDLSRYDFVFNSLFKMEPIASFFHDIKKVTILGTSNCGFLVKVSLKKEKWDKLFEMIELKIQDKNNTDPFFIILSNDNEERNVAARNILSTIPA